MLDVVAAFVVTGIVIFFVLLTTVLAPSDSIFLDYFGKQFEPILEVHLLDCVVSRAGHDQSGVFVLVVFFSTLVPLVVNTNHEFSFPQLLFAITHAILHGDLFTGIADAGCGLREMVVSDDEDANGSHLEFDGRVFGAVGTLAISLLHGLDNEIVMF